MTDMSSYTSLQVSLDSIWNRDYEPFEAEGCIVIRANDGFACENQNPHYHNTIDMLSLINWNYLASVTKMILATVFEVARS
jgi:hypothetical protein